MKNALSMIARQDISRIPQFWMKRKPFQMAYRPDRFGRVHGVSEEQLGTCASAPPGKEREMAESFWVALAESEMFSKDFRAISQAHVKALRGKVQPRADRGETSIAPSKKSKK